MNHLGNRRLWRTVLLSMLVPLALIAFWPSPVDQPVQGQIERLLRFLHTHGLPARFDYGFVEATANILLFVPIGFAASLAFATRRWWRTWAFGFVVSICIELGQLLFLHSRFASLLDVAANTGGAIVGALLSAYARQHASARPDTP